MKDNTSGSNEYGWSMESPSTPYSNKKCDYLISEDDIEDVLTKLVVIGDHAIPDIDFPYEAETHVGVHQTECEIMMFFADVMTEHDIPKYVVEEINGQYYMVAVFPNTPAPIGKSGLMYVARRVDFRPTKVQVYQFMFDCISGTWIVSS